MNELKQRNDLIDALIEKGTSIIGVDFASVCCGKEHAPVNQYCADRGVFVIKNLCNLKDVLDAGAYSLHTHIQLIMQI